MIEKLYKLKEAFQLISDQMSDPQIVNDVKEYI